MPNRNRAGPARPNREGSPSAGPRPSRPGPADSHRPGFAEACRRQSRALRDDPHERETLDWLAEAADTDGWR